MQSNVNLRSAKRAKNDEFYTRYVDAEKEMKAYLKYDFNVFRDKIILCPCDDPERSQFVKYFVDNFKALGLKKLIATGLKEDSNGVSAIAELNERGEVVTSSSLLRGDGDFRSPEVTALRDEVDMVITNPPFSLFREFTAWLMTGKTSFSIIGNMNAITYKEVFPIIQQNKMWLGDSHFNKGMYFIVPEDFVHSSTYKFKKSINGQAVSRVAGVCWFTNIEHRRRHLPLQLMSETENIKHSRHKLVRGVGYRKYDNYDAIEVPLVEAIPLDYDGIMGVPLTFLDKYNPDQFEILGTQRWGKSKELLKHYTGDVIPPENDKKTTIEGRETYDRIFIRHRKSQSPNEEG